MYFRHVGVIDGNTLVKQLSLQLLFQCLVTCDWW